MNTRCPECHCPGPHSLLERFTHWGAAHDRYRCRFCNHVSRAKVDTVEETPKAGNGVVFRPSSKVCCPECGSERTRVTSTRSPLRHHKCRECGHCFKSGEG